MPRTVVDCNFVEMQALMALARDPRESVVPDIFRQTPQVDHRIRDRREAGLGKPMLLAVALGLVCIALVIPAHLAVFAIVPVLVGVIAVLAAFRIMG